MDNIEVKKRFFKAFSNPTRIAIIEELRKGKRCVKELCEALSLEQSRVSHNLKCLEDCGFVVVERKGKHRFYSLEEDNIIPILKHIDRHLKGYARKLASCKRL